MKTRRITLSAIAAIHLICSADTAFAGPNIMALGNYRAVPFQRAEGRESFSGKEVIFSFEDPVFDFGRVVVRPSSNQPISVVRRDYFVGFSGNAKDVDYPIAPVAYGPMEVQNLRVAAIKDFSDKPVVAASDKKKDAPKENNRRSREDRHKPRDADKDKKGP